MAHGLDRQHFRSFEEVKKWIDSWIASKDTSFFRDGIRTQKTVSLIYGQRQNFFELN